MAMSRKHYTEAARILHAHRVHMDKTLVRGNPDTPDELFYRLANAFGHMFYEDNENFDWDRFRQACGVEASA